MITTRVLATPLDAALATAQAALEAAPAGADEVWLLPEGVHALGSGLTLGAAGKRLHLRGSDAVTLQFATGGLALVGARIAITELRLEAAATAIGVSIAAAEVAVRDLEVPSIVGAGDLKVLAIEAGDAGVVELDDVEIGEVAGVDVVAVAVTGGTVHGARVVVAKVTGTSATGIQVRAHGRTDLAELVVGAIDVTGAGTAIDVVALESVAVATARVDGVRAAVASGVLVFGGGPEVRVVDLRVRAITAASGDARGALLAGADVALRGFTIADVAGDDACGLIVVGGVDGRTGPAVELAFGTIEKVRALATPAAGARVLAAPTRRSVSVRDVAVRHVYGGPVPGGPAPAAPPAPPDPAWAAWAQALVQALASAVSTTLVLPPPPLAEATIGLHVSAIFEEVVPFADAFAAEPLEVADSAVAGVHGAAVAIEGGLRTTSVRRVAVDHAVCGAYLQGDRLIIANTTWHALRAGVLAGPGEIHAYDSLFSAIEGTPLALDADAEWLAFAKLWADHEDLRFAALGAMPFRDPGGPVPDPWLPGAAVALADLRLVASSRLHAEAVEPPPDLRDGEPRPPFAGAYPPEAGAQCDLYDPLADPHAAAPVAPPPSPVVDYRARDATALTRVMLDRARTVMTPWAERGAADFTTMVIETLAERLDHLAYQQERAVAEGFLEDARLRRSVEDHVRPLDYVVDRGLSATALIEVRVDFDALTAASDGDVGRTAATLAAAAAALATDPTNATLIDAHARALAVAQRAHDRALLYQEIAADGALELPAGTLVATTADDRLVFATEAPLTYAAALHELVLADDVARGSTTARVRLRPAPGGGAAVASDKQLAAQLAGQWLILRRLDGAAHVVRVTSAAGQEVVEIGWDPRRPLPFDAIPHAADDEAPAMAEVLGNLVVAHHGLPLAAIDPERVAADRRESVAAIKRALTLTVDGRTDDEVDLPFHPISVHARGYPFPGERRAGEPQLAVYVEGQPWRRVDDLAAELADREVWALRTSADGRTAIRFGTAAGQSALPRRAATIDIEPVLGGGAAGNVAVGVLARLLHVAFDPARSRFYGSLFREHPELLRQVIRVTNPLPAVGGRDPEALERMRYRAPLLLQRPLSAVAPEDYVRVALAVPEVRAAHARVVGGGIRPTVRVTVLLRDEDLLDDLPDPDERERREAEHLRRWAVVRKALEDARLLGYDVEAVPPRWVPLDLDVTVEAEPGAEAGAVRDAVIAAVAGDGGLFDPDASGLGGDVQIADLYRAIGAAPGVASTHVRRFRRLALGAPELVTTGTIAIAPDEVAVVRGPGRPRADGVLSVTVCGGLA